MNSHLLVMPLNLTSFQYPGKTFAAPVPKDMEELETVFPITFKR